MNIYLNPVGGVAGDMFVASVLDAFPDLEVDLFKAIDTLGLPENVSLRLDQYKDHGLGGKTFIIEEPRLNNSPRRLPELIAYIESSPLEHGVMHIAKKIFFLLAEAESEVHKLPRDSVTFHEVGEWDSILDILCASFLIYRLNADWFLDELPMGGGRISSAHGNIPVPAPATAALLRGYDFYDDGVVGERVTPTGAAIVKFLVDPKKRRPSQGKLISSGVGFGTKKFKNFANILRTLVFQPTNYDSGQEKDTVTKIEFEVDDQSPELLALGLGKIQNEPAVLDLMQSSVYGKKGRLAKRIQILCDACHMDKVINKCFDETSTVGVRYQLMDRRILKRYVKRVELNDMVFRVKLVNRNGRTTGKVEADDLNRLSGDHVEREILARRVIALALEDEDITK